MSDDILATMPRREAIDMAAEEWRERRELRFVVTSRRCVGHRIETAGEPCSVISISDPMPVAEPVRFRPSLHLRSVLPLSFVDVDPVNDPTWNLDVESDDYGQTWRAMLMTDEHAMAIWDFLSKTTEKLLVVHCFAGVSRSPSIAMAIADSLHIPRASIVWGEDRDPTETPPNQHVYHCVRRAFFLWKRAERLTQ